MEARLQTQIIRWLRSKGAFAFKTHPGLGTPTGTADIFFCKEGFYGWLEVKGAKNSKRQPGQTRFVEKMDEWSFARFVYPENWEQVKAELEPML